MPEPSLLRSRVDAQVDAALARGWTVLTANQRGARSLRRDFDHRQRARGLGHWQPPAVLAWDSWTASLWRRMLLDGQATALLLNHTQEHTVWAQVIAADAEGAASARPIAALADLAASAWRLLHGWRARGRLAAAADTADTRAFERWARAFDRQRLRANYLSEAQLTATLQDGVSAGKIAAGPGLLLVGFDARTPAQSALLEAARATGTAVEELELDAEPSDAEPSAQRIAVAASDPKEELLTAAHWLRDRLRERPEERIAVIVPALEAERAELDRVFRHVLAPELEDIAAPVGVGPFEFSLGVPLAQTPMVTAAFDILHWAMGPLPLDRISGLLLSPYFAHASEESLARAEFDASTLRRSHVLQPELSLDAFLGLLAGSPDTARLPGLRQYMWQLRRAAAERDLAGTRPARSTYAESAATALALLEAAGWSAAADDSVEFQTRQKWQTALDELATLDFAADSADAGHSSFAGAITALERIAAQTLFAPESREAPIQIMGPLESAGSVFDAVWFLGAADLTWPAPASPHPLLPWRLQREQGMPGAELARDLALARRISERIAESAPEVIFSYAHRNANGQQRLSPALAGLSLALGNPHELANLPPPPAPVLLEMIADETPVPAPPDRPVRGGASILQAQAACAFRAFAERRLGSTKPESPALGLDPMERGSLVHTVLEGFWAEVQSQAALKAMARDARDGVLLRAIDAALAKQVAKLAAKPGPGWPTAYVDTERQRLLNLLNPWLDYEAEHRTPFRVKAMEDRKEAAAIGPLRLELRLDRVDELLANGEPAGEVLLDYKTGAAIVSDWLGDRPEAPQLPLYAVIADPPQLAAVAFASVRAGKDLGLSGFESKPGVLDDRFRRPPKIGLDAQLQEWRMVLTRLAEEFVAGDARVAPKQYPGTCERCDQRLLCRLDPASLSADEIDDLELPDPDADDLEPGEVESYLV